MEWEVWSAVADNEPVDIEVDDQRPCHECLVLEQFWPAVDNPEAGEASLQRVACLDVVLSSGADVSDAGKAQFFPVSLNQGLHVSERWPQHKNKGHCQKKDARAQNHATLQEFGSIPAGALDEMLLFWFFLWRRRQRQREVTPLDSEAAQVGADRCQDDDDQYKDKDKGILCEHAPEVLGPIPAIKEPCRPVGGNTDGEVERHPTHVRYKGPLAHGEADPTDYPKQL
mmetsp:Transcript_130729/g.279592  ORF Transcript_130729/g.279592 Transcript_130729/m.279592 type:complete len:227 (+) Transcript_130729:512-1192(+)